MKTLGFALSITLALTVPASVLPAQEAGEACPPKPARELFTTAAGVTEAGVVQLNAGAQVSLGRDRAEARRFPAQLALGLCPGLDLRLAWSGPTTLKDPQGASRSGGGDPLLGSQVQLLGQERSGLDLGLAYWHKLPRASVAKGIGTGKADDTLLVTASRGAGPWEVDLNAGANWLGRQDAAGTVRQGALSLAVTRGLAPGWSCSLDTFALAGTGLGPRSVTSIAALSRDLGPDLTVDFGVEAGLTRSAERLALDAGVTWRLGRLWGRE